MLFATWLATSLGAQKLEDRQPIGSIVLRGGVRTGQVRLQVLEAPSAGDIVGVGANASRVRVVLITPHGQRVTEQNAAASGFTWRQDLHQRTPYEPLAMITFAKPGVAGRYILQVTSESADDTTDDTIKVTAWFARIVPTMRGYRESVSSLPGAQVLNPAPMGASAVLRFGLRRDEMISLLDVVVPDSTVQVTLVLPDGQVLRQDRTQGGITWTVFSYHGPPVQPGPDLGVFGQFIMPVQGCHHLIQLPQAAKGDYEIRASRVGRTGGQLRAAFVPLRGFSDPSAPPLPGQVRIRRPSAPRECFAGEQLDLSVGLLGEVGPAPPEFRVRIERTPEGTAVPDPIENLTITFTRGMDGDYHGSVVLTQAGFARIEVQAKGENTAGQPFADRVIFQWHVSPVVARVLSLDARAVDVDGDGKLDRLDITTELDVIVPGEYSESIYLMDASKKRIGDVGGANATLQAGHQTLTKSLAGWRIWHYLSEGPYEAHIEQLSQMSRGGSPRLVEGVERFSRVVPSSRDEWDRGLVYGEDKVSIHGILPAPSGRFRLAEVVWEVTTPGGQCWWSGGLRSTGGTLLTSGRGSELPPGRRRLSFFIYGAAIAAAGAQNWTFGADAECDGKSGHATFAPQALNVDASLYEPQNSDLNIVGTDSLHHFARGLWTTTLYVPGRVGAGTRFSLTRVPPELDARLTGDLGSELYVTVVPGAHPGRYFIGVAVSSGGETFTRDIALDLSPLDVKPAPK